MTTTNIAAIRTALAAVMTDTLTPTGDAHKRDSYVQANELIRMGTRPGSDVDREFRVLDIPPGEEDSFGRQTENLKHTTVILEIGHWKTADVLAGMSRRDTDCQQIVTAWHDKDNFPTQVGLIRLDSRTVRDSEEYWTTSLTFRMIYAGAI